MEIVINPPPGQTPQQNTSQGIRAKRRPPSLMKLRQELPTCRAAQPHRRGSAQPVRTIQRTNGAPRKANPRNQNSAIAGPARDPTVRRNVNARRDLATTPIPNSCRNPNQNPNADLNPNFGGSRHRRRNKNCQQPNTDKTKEAMQALDVEDM